MRDHHCDPEEALEIHCDVRAKQSMAIHWGTFPLADEDIAEPPLELARARIARPEKLRGGAFFAMALGATHVVGDAPQLDFSERHPKLFEYYNSHHKKLEEKGK
jgi:N-acyl-phosphatidylethanolamine-hydrolysing phospholipase D